MSDAYDQINAIADLIEPHEKAWFDAFESMGDPKSPKIGAQKWAELVEATRALNAVIDPHVADIARITENSESTLRQVFCSHGSENIDAHFGGNPSQRGWGPSAFLRCVAQYRSFNIKFWRSKGFDLKQLRCRARSTKTLH